MGMAFAAACFVAGDVAGADVARDVAAARSQPALRDQRLEPRDEVFGIVVGDEPRAYPLSDLGKSGIAIHDVVAGNRLDVAADAAGPRIVNARADVREAKTCGWGVWAREHPETSLWRPSAIAESETTRSVDAIHVTEFHDYHTALSCAFAQARQTSINPEPPGVFVVTGTLENVTKDVVNHVVLRYELVDKAGKVVYREEGFNRAAEALASPNPIRPSEVLPIQGGASDTFRMIFITEELPVFDKARVSVARVY